MTEAVSKAMTTAFEEIFNNDYYLNEFLKEKGLDEINWKL